MRKLIALSVFWLSTACVATDVGNPQTDEENESEVQLEAFEEEIRNALMLDDGIELTHAWVATERVSFEGCDTESETESETQDELEYRVPSVTDLLSGTTFPAPIVVRERVASVCSLELEVRPLTAQELPQGAPADLAGHSMVVRGHRKDGNPFVVHATVTESFELEGDIDLLGRNQFVVGFAVNGWITQSQIASLSGDPILIDSSTHEDVYDAFSDTVVDSLRLFRDEVGTTPIAR